jgi:hypothetical protein
VQEWSIVQGGRAVDVKGLQIEFNRYGVSVKLGFGRRGSLTSCGVGGKGTQVSPCMFMLGCAPDGVVYWILSCFQDDEHGYPERPDMKTCKIKSVI